MDKTASAMVYMIEELGDARLRCDQLLRYIERAVQLIEKSSHRDHFFEVAGDLIRAVPETTFKLHKALQAVALAADRLDYEEIKQDLRPEKVEELERVLKDVRIRHVQRRSDPMKPSEAMQTLRSLAARTKESGVLPLEDTLKLITALEAGNKTASTEKIAEGLENLADAIENPPESGGDPSRARLATILRRMVADSLDTTSFTPSRVVARVLGTDKTARLSEALQAYDDGVRSGKGTSVTTKDALSNYNREKGYLKGYLDDLDKLSKKPSSSSPKTQIGRAYQSVLDLITSLGQIQGAHSSDKTASDDDKEARFEEGEPTDPTENMSPEDAKAWKSNTDKYEDKFKKEASWKVEAGIAPAPTVVKRSAENTVQQILNARVAARSLADQLHGIYEDATGVNYTDNYDNKEVKKIRDALRDFDHAARVYSDIEYFYKKLLPKLVQPGVRLASEDAWKVEADIKKMPTVERIVAAVERLGKSMKDALNKYKSDPERNAPQLENLKSDISELGSFLRILDRNVTASDDDDKEARFEEGKPADPTKDMSPEDAKKWKENTDKYEDKFKEASTTSIDPWKIA